MRGRLIFPFLAEIHRLDTLTTASSDPSGYDEDFKEPIVVDTDQDGIGERVRNEHPPVRVPCQVEPKSFEELQMLASGNSPQSTLNLVFHFKNLDQMGLVDTYGAAMIRPGDRLGAIYDKSGGLVQEMRNPLYVTEAKPMGFGLNMSKPHRNLLFVTFGSHEQGARRGA